MNASWRDLDGDWHISEERRAQPRAVLELGAKRFCPYQAFAYLSVKRSADIAARHHHAENATAATDPTGEELNLAAVKVVALSADAFAIRSRADLH